MKNKLTFTICILAAASFCLPVAQSQVQSDPEQQRVKQALLERLPRADLGNGYFKNPVLAGPGSDNSVVRVGPDFYMLAGRGWPGEMIWHSRDLVNWRPLTRALHTVEGGTWASDITYHNGKYYIYTTDVSAARGDAQSLNMAQRSLTGVPFKDQGDRAFKNIVMWADSPSGPWSEPVNLGVYGVFDPGHIVDREGNRYLYFNKGMIIQLTPGGLGTVGDLKIAYEGWTYPEDWVVECHCLEAPKLTYHNGYYYMASAEGGTSGPSTAHMGVMARSRSVEGPWENSPYNPMVRTSSQEEKWWRQGHGTLIDDIEGNWWFLYTGYEKEAAHFGKQGLLLPVEWTDDGWPRITPGTNVNDLFRKPAGENVGNGMPLSDDFTGVELGIQWNYERNADPGELFDIGGGRLVMKAGGTNSSDAVALGVMPANKSFEVDVQVSISEGTEGGLTYGNVATAGFKQGELFARGRSLGNTLPWDDLQVWVRIRNLNGDISFFYSRDGENWTPFRRSTTGTTRQVSLYAAGTGEVTFRNFRYRGLD